MSAVSSAPRIDPRPLIVGSIFLAGLLVLLHPVPAYADEGSVFGDVVVERGSSEDEVSTVFGDATVRGKVSGDVHSALGDVRIEAPVGGNVNSGFGDIRVDAPVGGEVDAGFGDVRVNSQVGGIDVDHGDVFLGRRAEVMEHSRVGDGVVRRHPDAVVHGPHMAAGMMPDFGSSEEDDLFGILGWIVGSAGFAACAVLAAVLAPRSLAAAARRAEGATGRSFVVGLVSLPAVLLLSVALAVSVVGVPLLVLLAPAYLALVFFGALVAAFSVGRKVVMATGRYRSGNALAAVVGAFLVAATVLIPFVGELVLFALALIGTGAAVLALFSRRRTPRTPYPSYEAFVQDRREE
jgi:hypothetical protein